MKLKQKTYKHRIAVSCPGIAVRNYFDCGGQLATPIKSVELHKAMCAIKNSSFN